MKMTSTTRRRFNSTIATLLSALLLAALICRVSRADDSGNTLKLADGKIQLSAPTGWESKKPKYPNIVMYEFAVKAAKGDDRDGRVTIGGAGGASVAANMNRWKGQYKLAPGQSPSQQEMKIADQTVHVLDISGTYSPPPFLGEPSQEDSRMMAAIIETAERGSYYVRFYGPRRTVEANKVAFLEMIKSLKVE